MAGVVPKRTTSGRKQWTLQYDSPNSLRRLRSQLASDGCPDSQVVLAKQLLQGSSEFEAENKENAQLGVYWLIKASEQGNIEATQLLRTCLSSGKGITEHNFLDVKICISMTQDEKLARKAAREMFASLSNGGNYITSDQLQRKILAINQGETSHKSKLENQQSEEEPNGELMNNIDETSDTDEETDWSQRSDSSNEKLTEDSLVSAAVDYAHGQLPIVNRVLSLTYPNLKAFDHIPFILWSLYNPILALKIAYFKFMRFIGQKTISFLFPLAKSELQLVFLLFIYAFVNTEHMILFIPMLIYYISFLVMFINTFQMLQTKREFVDFRLWSGLFICYTRGELNAEQAEHQYVKNNLKPYGQFFLALLVNLIVYPLIAEQWIPQSELTIIAFCFTFMTLVGFMPMKRSKTLLDGYVLLSFAVNVLAKYPYEIDPVVAQGWRFLDLEIPNFPSYVIGNGIEFCINFKFCLYVCIPLLLIKIASGENWRGTYKSLIPHCVTLSWLQICIISSQGATMFGFLRGTLALVGIVAFLPLVGIMSVLLPVAAVTKWLITSNVIYSFCVFVLLSALGIFTCWLCARTRFKKHTAIIQVTLMIVAFIVLINSVVVKDDNEFMYSKHSVPETLSWDVYSKFCHQPMWQEENVAQVQVKCAELDNSLVHWDGYITDIKVKSVSNFWKSIFDKFPKLVSDYLYCLYGEEANNECDSFPAAARNDCRGFYDVLKSLHPCSLEKFNVYSFAISMKMQSGIWAKSSEVNIIVDDYFKNFTLLLKPNDHIWYKGVLINNPSEGPDSILGGLKPFVKLTEIGCIACIERNLTELKLANGTYNIGDLYSSVIKGIKFVLNLVLYPIVTLK